MRMTTTDTTRIEATTASMPVGVAVPVPGSRPSVERALPVPFTPLAH